MKLCIQIPCLNEERTLPETLAALPKSVDGFEELMVVIIDDGSTDNTVQVARENGVSHFVQFKENRGLAAAFTAGIEKCVALGADVIVNTDADNQYNAQDIEKLTGPILAGKADMVVGARDMDAIPEFSPTKRKLQKMGSSVVRKLSGTDVQDATSGFRAITRDLAKNLTVHSDYTYTLETLIQAGQKNFVVTSVPIRTNPKTRDSRLMRSTVEYLWRSFITMFRIYTLYQPLRVFAGMGSLSFLVGIIIGLRFVFYYVTQGGQGHVQSLILVAILLLIGFLLIVFGLLADLLSANRKLIEDLRLRVRNLEDDK